MEGLGGGLGVGLVGLVLCVGLGGRIGWLCGVVGPGDGLGVVSG